MLAKFWHELAVLAELILQELRGGGTPWDSWDTSQPFFGNYFLGGYVILILLNGDYKNVFLEIICPNQIFILSATPVERSAPAHEPKLHNISREKCFSSCLASAHSVFTKHESLYLVEKTCYIYPLWQYGLWSFQTGGTKLERFLPKIGHHFRK